MVNNALDNMPYDVIGLRLPNGQIKVAKNNFGPIGEVCANESEFTSKYQQVNEGASAAPTCLIMDMVNG